MFYLCKVKQKRAFLPLNNVHRTKMDLKDRIKQLMEEQHMTQQVFADFLNQAPATLSSIFNGRTRPTLNIVNDIKSKFPDISIEWLLYGEGDMYKSASTPTEMSPETPVPGTDLLLQFDTPSPAPHQTTPSATPFQQSVRNTRLESVREELKLLDKTPRRVTEIRVYYDDQTYETFVPAKKN